MREKLKAIRSVLRVHELMEEMREAELLRVVAEAREVERAIALQREIAQSASNGWRNALLDDDNLTASVSVVRQKLAHGREARLIPMLSETERRSDELRVRYIDSSRWTERVSRLTRKIEDEVKAAEEKRLQRETDERYLSRRRWAQSKLASPER